jgi:hypothetical protein
MAKKRRKPMGPDIKGQLADGREFWVFSGEPWEQWKDKKDKYAKFSDGTVRRFSGFGEMESVELTTENYLNPETGNDHVYGFCRGLIKFGGVTVYGFLSSEVGYGLILAHEKLIKLRWLRRTLLQNLSPEGIANTFNNRPVCYREIPARVRRYDAANGTIHLIAERGHEFPPLASNLDPPKIMQVDLLSELIRWAREEDEE